MAPIITIEEAYDRPQPDTFAGDEAWDKFWQDATVIGSAVVEETPNLKLRTTFQGPNHHERAAAFARFIGAFRLLIEVPAKPTT